MKYKKKILYYTCCCILTTYLNAQNNLVLNPSFEQLIHCPNNYEEADTAKYWGWLNNTTILPAQTAYDCRGNIITLCCTNPANCGEPYNWFGYQKPRTGNSYISLASIYSSPPFLINKRDYLKGQLSTALTAGKNYCLTFYYNATNYIQWVTNRFGAYVDNNTVASYSCCSNMPVTPQAQNNPALFMNDTMNWVKIQGSFTAIGNENTITLGNFVDSVTIQYQLFNGTSSGVHAPYYNIDDISLLPMDLAAYAGNDTSICRGDSAYIGRAREVGLDDDCIWYILGNNNAIDTAAGIWVKPVTTTSYVVEQNICGAISYDTVIVNVKQPFISVLSNTTICTGDSIQIGNSPIANITYQWQPTVNIANAAAAQTYVKPNNTTTYTLFTTPGINSNYCPVTESASIKITVKPILKGDITITASSKNICPNQPVQLQAVVTNSLGLQWSWQPVNTLNYDSIPNPIATPSLSTIYQLITTPDSTSNYCNTPDTLQIIIRIITLQPNAYAGIDTIICSNLLSTSNSQIMIGSSANPCSWCTYSWQPINGLQNSNTAYTSLSANQLGIGNNIYTLTKTDSCQTTNSTITLLVKYCNVDSLIIQVPNVFSPNNDGINDTWGWLLIDNGISLFNIETKIYNRWGRLVFESTNIHQDWTGNDLYGGSLCSEGAYFYIISYINGNTNETKTLKGFLQLIR